MDNQNTLRRIMSTDIIVTWTLTSDLDLHDWPEHGQCVPVCRISRSKDRSSTSKIIVRTHNHTDSSAWTSNAVRKDKITHYTRIWYAMQHRTVLIIFLLVLQTIVLGQMLSAGGDEGLLMRPWPCGCVSNVTVLVLFQNLFNCIPSTGAHWLLLLGAVYTFLTYLFTYFAFSALTLLVWRHAGRASGL